MYDLLYPAMNYRRTKRFIVSKQKERLDIHHVEILNKVRNDYLSWRKRVANEHPLVRALHLGNAITDDIYRSYLMIQDQSLSIASVLGWYNRNTRGIALPKPMFFMDNDVAECVVLKEFEDSSRLVYECEINSDDSWLEWKPVRCVYHPYTDMDYYPCGSHYGEPRVPFGTMRVAVIEVDLALLYTQYRHWLASDLSMGDGVRFDATHFIAQVPLINMLDTQMSISYFNRVVAYFTGKEIPSSRKLHRQHTYSNTYRYVDDGILEVLKNFKKAGSMTYSMIMDNLPTLGDFNNGEHFKISPDGIDVIQMAEVYAAACLPGMEVWLKLIVEMQQQKWNTDDLAHLARGYKRVAQKGYFRERERRTNRIALNDGLILDEMKPLLGRRVR